MLSPFQQKKFTHLFSLFDADRNGALSPSDFQSIARGLAASRGIAEGSPEFQMLEFGLMMIWNNTVKHGDVNADGRVTLEEFLLHEGRLMEQARRDYRVYDDYANLITRGVFDLGDSDHDGRLTMEDWRSILVAFHVAADDADNTFRRLDKNGDGFIDRGEVTQAAYEFHWSEDVGAAGNWFFGPLP